MKTYLVLNLFVLFQFGHCAHKCNYRVFGRPDLYDCAGAFLKLPDGSSREATPKLTTLRKFVEPQFLEPPFRPVDAYMGAEMEQLPKFWRYGKPTNL